MLRKNRSGSDPRKTTRRSLEWTRIRIRRARGEPNPDQMAKKTRSGSDPQKQPVGENNVFHIYCMDHKYRTNVVSTYHYADWLRFSSILTYNTTDSPRSVAQFYIESYCIQWVRTSCTCSIYSCSNTVKCKKN